MKKKIFSINLVFGCISHGLRIFKDILGVWLGLNSKNRTVGEPGVGWIFCKVYPFNLPRFFFVFLTPQPLAYPSMIIPEEIVVHTVGAKHSCPRCVYRCWTCLGGFSLLLPQAHLTMTWEICFQPQMFIYFAHLVLQACAEFPFQLLIPLYPSWDTYFCTLRSNFFPKTWCPWYLA